jgi:hypothetical protein
VIFCHLFFLPEKYSAEMAMLFNWLELLEMNTSLVVQARYLWEGEGFGGLISQRRSGSSLFYASDQSANKNSSKLA